MFKAKRKYKPSSTILGALRYCAILLLITLFSFCISIRSYAAGGDVIWQYGDTPQTAKQEAKAMAVDSSGNTVITGISQQSGTYDYYTVKINAAGTTILWSNSYDKAGGEDYATAIAIDSDDNVIVTGYAWNGTNYDFHTIKYNAADGAILWQDSFNADTDGDDYNTTLTLDDLNNIYIGGSSQQVSGIDDIILIKYGPNGPNPDGSPIWQTTYNGSANGHDKITAITAGIDGIALTGLSQNSTPDFDALTLKYEFDGSLRWEKRKSLSGDDRGRTVNMDQSGNVVMAGTLYNGSNKDIYIAKYNSSTGALAWENTYDGGYDDEPVKVFIDSAGDIYMTGYTFLLSSANDIYTARFNASTGTVQWSETFNSTNGNNDRGIGIGVDASGDVFVSGDTYDAALENYNFQTLKYTKDGGVLLWQQAYNGSAGKNDRVAGINITSSGEPIVAGYSDMWTSGASDYDYYALKYDPGLLNPPTALNAVTISTSQIDLSWTDNSSNEDGFKIERKIGDFGTYSQIATVGPDITSYNSDGLAADTKYYYKVKSYNSTNGDSHYSNEEYSVTTVVSFTAPATTYTYNGADAGDDYVSAVAVGPDNTPVVTGYSYSIAGQYDYYSLKLNKDTLALDWDARYDSDQNDMDMAVSILVDDNNDILVSGTSYLFSIQSDGNTNDIYSIKYPPTGPPETWNDQYNGPAGDDDRSSIVDVSVDGSNSYVVTGYGRNADWNDDIYVVKYLSDGTREWAATPYDGGVFGHDYPAAVAFDPSGDIVMTGYTYNGTDYDFVTIKYSGSDGSVIWTDVYNIANTGNDFTRGISIDPSGNVYVTGLAVTTSGNEDFYTIKHDGTNGTRLWERSFNGFANGIDEAMEVKVDPVSNDIVVAGTTLAGADNNEFHVIRYDPDGNVVWERTLDRPASNDFVVAMAMDLSGNIHIAGDTDSGADTNVIAIQYDHEGSFVDGTEYNGTANGYDGAAAIIASSIGEVFVGGYTMNASGNADYLVFKITGDDLLVPSPLNAAFPDYTQIDLSWTDNSRNEDGFRLERRVGSCSSSNPWMLIFSAPSGTTSYSDSGLNIGAEYCYRVRAYNNSGKVSRWVEKQTTTLSAQAPGAMAFTGNNSTEAGLAWTDNTINETGFTIQKCTGTGCDFSSVVEFNVLADTETFLDDTVCESTIYSYRIKSFKTNEWTTNYSNVITITTDPMASPTILSALRVSEAQVDLSWTDNTGDETGFRIERCSGAGCSDFSEIAIVEADVTTYNNTGITQATSYTYRVRAYKTAVCSWASGYSDTSSASTTILDPGGLSATTINTTHIDLSWTEETATETGFKIERCEGAACSTFAEIAATGADITTYSDTSVCENTNYSYRVKSYKTSEWESGYSNESSAVTNARSAPADLAVTATSESQINLSWSDNTDDESGFEIERCTGTGCVDFGLLTTVSSAADPVSYWKLDEGSGTTAYNTIGTNNATIDGPIWTAGKYGSALSFDGSNDFVQVADDNSLDLTTAGSIEVWAKKNTQKSYQTYVAKGHTQAYQLMDYSNTGRIALRWGSNNNNLITDEVVPTGTWQHIVGTYDGSYLKIYINGNLSKSVSYTTNAVANTTPLRIGARDDGSYFNGLIDEVIIFNRALSGAEVLSHYQDGLPPYKSYSDAGLNPGTTYNYRVRTYKNATCSWITAYTNTSETATLLPPPPGDISATALNTTEINIAWSDNTDTETGFRIERCTGAGCDFSTVDEFILAADVTSYSDTSACENTSYRYRVRAEKSNSPIWETEWAVPTNDITTPAINAPAALTATKINEAQIDLAWTANTNDETGFNIERCAGAGCINFTLQTTVSGVSIYSDTGLAANEIYRYRVYASKDAACAWSTGYSNEAEELTTPPLPTDLTATAVDTTRIDLSWNEYNNTESGFRIERCTGAGCINYTEIAAVSADTTSYSDTTLCSDTTYNYRVKAYKTSEWETDYSNSSNAATTATTAPGSLSATRDSETQINISWTDNMPDETGFSIERCAGDACSDFAQIANVGADITNLSDAGLVFETSYTYRVSSYKTADCGWTTGYSNTSTAVTSVTVPAGLTATTINTTQIDLLWTNTTDSETGFKVERCTGSGCSDFGEIAALNAYATAYSDTSVCNTATYTYRVKADKQPGLSNDGSGCWTRKAPLTINDFVSDYPVKVTITYDTDMQQDFSDIRFFYETASIELPYWIESKTDGVSAEIYFKAPADNSIYMYYGNPNASSSSNELNVFTLYDPASHSFTSSSQVLNVGGGGTWDDAHVYMSSMIKDNSTYKMWYVGHDGTNTRIGYATSNNGTSWTKYASNPVLNLGASGTWDDTNLQYLTVIKDESTYKMWYSGHDGTKWRIGYATSSDGISWTKHASNPVIDLSTPGAWDDEGLLVNEVIKDGSVYKIWYSGSDGTNWRIGYATSSDGMSWTKHASNPVLNIGAGGTWDDLHAYLSSVLKDIDGTYKMWYSGHDGSNVRFGYASSNDGISWTKYASNPILDHGADGTWDDVHLYFPSVIKDNGGFYKMWHSGHNGSNWRIGYTSVRPDGSASPEPSVITGSEEQSACYTFSTGWETGYSNEAAAATLSLFEPTGLLTTAFTDTESELDWTDNTMDETGFKIERCSGGLCSDFTEIDTTGSNIEIYGDSELNTETVYCYRVRAYKTAFCAWNSSYSNESCDMTFSAHATDLTATALSSMVIRLDWIDNSNDEDGYEIEVQIFNGGFVKIATIAPNMTTFTDTMGIQPEKEYRYRVRAFRGTDNTPYSNEAAVTTPAWLETDDTCAN